MKEIGLLSRPHKAPSYGIRFIGARSPHQNESAEHAPNYSKAQDVYVVDESSKAIAHFRTLDNEKKETTKRFYTKQSKKVTALLYYNHPTSMIDDPLPPEDNIIFDEVDQIYATTNGNSQ
jgi:hypothetical protein